MGQKPESKTITIEKVSQCHLFSCTLAHLDCGRESIISDVVTHVMCQ